MADVLTAEQRKKNMRSIRSEDTKAEIVLRKALWQRGYRYRKNYEQLPGKPDIVLIKYRICIFVDSEFFHGKDFENGYTSKKYSSLKEQLENSNNSDFWLKKIKRNIERDCEIEAKLRGLGWHVLRFWSKDVVNQTEDCIKAIEELIFQYIATE